jgi:uncharacterized Zn-binding protein involved in type VI secretion
MNLEALSQTVNSTISSVKSAGDVVTLETSPLENPARAISTVTGAISSVATLPLELANTGIALATNAISSVLPPFPAAQLGSLYVGLPHGHAHPPSMIPPAPPVPLPSLGAVMLGTCVRVLVGGLPAARCGDLGLAPTCAGFAPFFGIDFGSSKVFIGGTRAARVGIDFCTVCTKDAGAVTRGLAAAMISAAQAIAIPVAADLIDAAEAASSDPAMAGAKALQAAMTAAQAAADAAASVASATKGTDPAIPPALPGAIVLGAFTVLIAGLPLPNTPDPAKWLFNKIKGLLKKRKGGAGGGAEAGGGGGCPG